MFARTVLVATLVVLACATLTTAQPAQPVYDVTTYGAVGDGHTDDTLAVEKAVQAWLQSPTGGILLFPVGTFMLLQPPSFSAYIYAQLPTSSSSSPIAWNIAGAGAFGGVGNATFIVYNSTAAFCIEVASNPNNIGGGSISGLTIIAFEQPGSTSGTNAQISLSNIVNWEIVGVLLDVPTGSDVTGIIVQGTSQTILVRNTIFANATLAVVLESTTDVLFENVAIQGQVASPPLLNTVGVMVTEGSDDIRFDHVKMQNLAFGAQASGRVGGARGLTFSNTAFYDIAYAGVSIAMPGTYTFNNCGFNVTNGIIDSSEGGIVTLPNIADLTVTVSNVAFIGQTSGISQLSGSFRISQVLFEGCDFGFYYNVTNPALLGGVSPFQLTHSVFESTVAYPAMIVGGSNWVLADNNCLSGLNAVAASCDLGCVIDNNANCQYIPTEETEGKQQQNVNNIKIAQE